MINLHNLLRIAIINFFVFFSMFYYIDRKPPLSQKQLAIAHPLVNTVQLTPTPTSLLTKKLLPTPSSKKETAALAISKAPEEPTSVPQQETTADLVRVHNSPSDCWIAYQGHAYDITGYFGSHPGGDAIMAKYCGQEATAAFNSKDKSPASPHSQSAVELLAQYLVK